MSRDYPELVALAPAHADAAARLFMHISPNYLLSRLGADFLANVFWRPFYSTALDFGFVWQSGGRVVGLAAGTVARQGLVKRAIAGAPLTCATQLLLGVLRSPTVVKDGLDLARRLAKEQGDTGPEAELITLGLMPREAVAVVSPTTGQRVSPAVILLRACAEKMREAGAADFRLYTAAENHLACRLYRNLGFSEARRFQLFGEERVCFVRSTRFEDPL